MAVDRYCDSIATGCKCQGTILRFDVTIPRIKQSMNEAPFNLLTAEFGAISNHTHVYKSPRQRCKIIKPSSVGVCFVTVRREGG